LHKLANNKNSDVRSRTASAIGSAFSCVLDKQQAWNDLHKLTNDKNSDVRRNAASAVGLVFSNLPDKQQAWNDVHRLTNDKDSNVRSSAAEALGSAFSQTPDKKQAWDDLIRLANDKEKDVKVYANHSLGKVSIFKASQAEKNEDYKEELENAITFFEKAVKESSASWRNPSQFCLPFYHSFHTILFKKQEAREEVDKYLSEAKDAVEGSKSKETLFEIIDNLANALKEVQSLENLDLEAKKDELNFYRKYCDRAAELMKDTEKTAPFATIAMRKGLPILDRNLKELLEKVKGEAKIACKESKGTDTEEVACEINKEIQKWEISNPEEMIQNIEDLAYILKSKVADVPENEYIINKIELMRQERNLNKQYRILLFVIARIPTMRVIQERDLDSKLLKLDLICHKTDSIETKTDRIETKTDSIKAKVDLIQNELHRGLENLDDLSLKVGGKEGENITYFSEKLLEITKKGDLEAVKRFLEDVLKNENTLINEIDTSSAPQKEKEESKRSISKLRSLLKDLTNPMKKFGKDVANEIVVSYTAKGIVEVVLPMMSLAVFGVPIPSQMINILTNAVRT